jgi:carboxypeptidase C (cathepsin A)
MSFFTRNLWTGLLVLFAAAILVGTGVYALADDNAQQNKSQVDTSASKSRYFKPTETTTSGSVTAAGVTVPYKAVVGTLVVHPKDWDDAVPADKDKKDDGDTNPTAEAAMSFVAYFKDGAPAENRPITFLYNGGPGSSTVWLHMGAFGPKRVKTLDDAHTPAAPYQIVNNQYSLLDVSDLVFVDAPGTGFGRIAGKDKEKAFWAPIPTRTPSPSSSSRSCPSTTAGIRRNIFSAKATARRVRRSSSTSCRTTTASTSTA